MTSIASRTLAGGAAGFAATLPMSASMLALQRWLPGRDRGRLPPETITATLEQKTGLQPANRAQHLLLTGANHFGYGAATGALFGLTNLSRQRGLPLSGVGFGLLVWTASYLGFLPLGGLSKPATEDPARRNALMIAAHVVWGASLEYASRALQPGSGR